MSSAVLPRVISVNKHILESLGPEIDKQVRKECKYNSTGFYC